MDISLLRRFVLRFLASSLSVKMTLVCFVFGIVSFIGAVITYINQEDAQLPQKFFLIEDQEVSSPSGSILVSITGAVVSPGVYRVKPGARVADVLREAGGFASSSAQTWIAENINLAKTVQDQTHIFIPWLSAQRTTAQPQSIESNPLNEGSNQVRLNINKATELQILELEGIGEQRARKILENKPYSDSQDFLNRSEVPLSIANKILDVIQFSD